MKTPRYTCIHTPTERKSCDFSFEISNSQSGRKKKIFKIQKQGKENIIKMIPGKKISKRYKPLEEKNYSFDLQDLNNCDKDHPGQNSFSQLAPH